MDNTVIPKIGETEIKQKANPFPEVIEPMDSDWWLNEKQKSVCDAFLGESFMDNIVAFKTRYNPKTIDSAKSGACRFFKMAKVRRYLYIRTKEIRTNVKLSQEQILSDMIDLKEMALGRKDQHLILGHSEGFPVKTIGRTTDLKAANAVLTQLGKFHELGMWIDKKETEVKVVNFNFDMGRPEKTINHDE